MMHHWPWGFNLTPTSCSARHVLYCGAAFCPSMVPVQISKRSFPERPALFLMFCYLHNMLWSDIGGVRFHNCYVMLCDCHRLIAWCVSLPLSMTTDLPVFRASIHPSIHPSVHTVSQILCVPPRPHHQHEFVEKASCTCIVCHVDKTQHECIVIARYNSNMNIKWTQNATCISVGKPQHQHIIFWKQHV